jgi:hypothetical protein
LNRSFDYHREECSAKRRPDHPVAVRSQLLVQKKERCPGTDLLDDFVIEASNAQLPFNLFGPFEPRDYDPLRHDAFLSGLVLYYKSIDDM